MRPTDDQLNRLTQELERLFRIGLNEQESAFRANTQIDQILDKLRASLTEGMSPREPAELIRLAVQRFFSDQRLADLKHARLVSFGLALRALPEELCILEHTESLRALMSETSGIGQWQHRPRWFRRCFQGLVYSYFAYDPEHAEASNAGRLNWDALRDYLHKHDAYIDCGDMNPDWVNTVYENSTLFSTNPCGPYAEEILGGNSDAVEGICQVLGIQQDSWFLRKLILAQVEFAIAQPYAKFLSLLPQLLTVLKPQIVLRDRGLILLLDKYASSSSVVVHQALQDAAVRWWGNPWLPSNQTRWGGVTQRARDMVADWLKREFIDAFFSKLADGGIGDKRRIEFWTRYVKKIDHIQFALGPKALGSDDDDFVVLRRKMDGLITKLQTSPSKNNAFVMMMGEIVAVEFSDIGNALYVYDRRKDLPFDLKTSVRMEVNVRNSLKTTDAVCRLNHQDGILGWDTWEEMFEDTLAKDYDLEPEGRVESASKPNRERATTRGRASISRNQRELLTWDEAASRRFSFGLLKKMCDQDDIEIEDLTHRNGNLWVRTDRSNIDRNFALSTWGFAYKSPKGWWKAGET